MLLRAKEEAKKSNHKKFKLGCVVTYKHNIIGSGSNGTKTDPIQKEFNRYREFKYSNNYEPDSIHAEAKAIKSISYVVGRNINWKRVNVYVYRIRKDGSGACAKPCRACQALMRSLGISGCIFSEDNDAIGYIEF